MAALGADTAQLVQLVEPALRRVGVVLGLALLGLLLRLGLEFEVPLVEVGVRLLLRRLPEGSGEPGGQLLRVSSVYPHAGLATGGNVITITGQGFRDLGGIFCR